MNIENSRKIEKQSKTISKTLKISKKQNKCKTQMKKTKRMKKHGNSKIQEISNKKTENQKFRIIRKTEIYKV